MKLIWYLSSLITVLMILVNNPKSSGFGNISSQVQMFSYTKSSQANIQLITMVTALMFLLFTIILASHFFI